jgi:hypothetical protein
VTSVVLTGVLTRAETLPSDAETLTSEFATVTSTVGCDGSGFPDGGCGGFDCVSDGACDESGGVTDGARGGSGLVVPEGVPPPGFSD